MPLDNSYSILWPWRQEMPIFPWPGRQWMHLAAGSQKCQCPSVQQCTRTQCQQRRPNHLKIPRLHLFWQILKFIMSRKNAIISLFKRFTSMCPPLFLHPIAEEKTYGQLGREHSYRAEWQSGHQHTVVHLSNQQHPKRCPQPSPNADEIWKEKVFFSLFQYCVIIRICVICVGTIFRGLNYISATERLTRTDDIEIKIEAKFIKLYQLYGYTVTVQRPLHIYHWNEVFCIKYAEHYICIRTRSL